MTGTPTAAARNGLFLIARNDSPNGECTIRRANKKQHEQHRERVEEADLAEHIEAKEAKHRRHLDALQAIGAAGDVGKTFAKRFQQKRDAERHHQPGQIDAADHEKAGDEADYCGGETREHQRQLPAR